MDRLLASPHYGERWAAPWLDLARYADTNGYEKDLRRTMWKYRDWVINAFNEDMSFREFTIEQIAGDMLPHPTTDQLIATRIQSQRHDQHGRRRRSRKNTTGTRRWIASTPPPRSGWASTLGCAECHNHKFDPFTQKDYYRFLAFFAGEEYQDADMERTVISRAKPGLELPTPEQAAKSKELRAEIAKLQTVLDTPTPQLAAAQAQWEQDIKAAEAQWTVLQPSHYVSTGWGNAEAAAGWFDSGGRQESGRRRL